MIFSRLLVAALSIVSAAAAAVNTPCKDASAVGVAKRDVAVLSPWADATAQVKAQGPLVADAMAGPREGREAKFMVITANILDITQKCNAATTATKFSLLKLSDNDTSDAMGKYSQAVWRICRSMKGTRSAELAAQIGAIMDELESMQTKCQGLIPTLIGNALEKFNLGMYKISAIYSAVSA